MEDLSSDMEYRQDNHDIVCPPLGGRILTLEELVHGLEFLEDRKATTVTF